MRRILLLFICALLTIGVHAQIKTSKGYDGRWISHNALTVNYTNNNNLHELTFYPIGDSPSNFLWKFNFFHIFHEDEIKGHRKISMWFEFPCTFKYYASDEYPTLVSQLAAYGYPMVCPTNHNTQRGQMPCVQKTAKATIRIAPFRKSPTLFEIYVDGMRFAIDLGNARL